MLKCWRLQTILETTSCKPACVCHWWWETTEIPSWETLMMQTFDWRETCLNALTCFSSSCLSESFFKRHDMLWEEDERQASFRCNWQPLRATVLVLLTKTSTIILTVLLHKRLETRRVGRKHKSFPIHTHLLQYYPLSFIGCLENDSRVASLCLFSHVLKASSWSRRLKAVILSRDTV